ncbi:MAG: tRNA (N6-threonylcarbamoyladenosine(37)-N6)-methyltransferase TrmO, partial [Chloroflexi bacterium]|nr:tRNA (N6-threonylcarbamoyladenosine(37)-N6)-methyltransferase TrmO [Chloroflexota bacterium]
IEKATHLIVLYWCHMARRDVLVTKTPYGPEERGVFACRSPSRPNPIAFCVADVVKVERNRVIVKGLDAVDGSPLLDVKPYSASLDCVSEARIGWLEARVYKEVDSDAQDRRQRPRGQRQEHPGGPARPDAGPREQGVGGGRG